MNGPKDGEKVREAWRLGVKCKTWGRLVLGSWFSCVITMSLLGVKYIS